jgi:hypothetical protein
VVWRDDQGMITNSTNKKYEIRVSNHLDSHWSAWFEGWTITNLENGEVLLSCSNVDQSMLHGALNKLRDLNLTVLSVLRVQEEG